MGRGKPPLSTLDLPGTLHLLLDLGTLTIQSEDPYPRDRSIQEIGLPPNLGWGWTPPSEGGGVRPKDGGIVGGQP